MILSKCGILNFESPSYSKEYKLENVMNTNQLINAIVYVYFLDTNQGFVIGIRKQLF